MRTASKSPAGKEMVASPCGQASCGPEDAQCGLYTRGGGEQGPFHLPGGAPRKPELRNAGKLPDRELRVSSDFCVVFIVWLHCI